MITRNQTIHFQFNEPVLLGDGIVTVSIFDVLTQSILFDEIKDTANKLLVQKTNEFIISLPLQKIPFYPYSLYKVDFIIWIYW